MMSSALETYSLSEMLVIILTSAIEVGTEIKCFVKRFRDMLV